MRGMFGRTLAALPVLLLTVGSLHAQFGQSGFVSLRGKIVGYHEYERLEVVLESSPFHVAAVTYSTNLGDFIFGGVPAGTYEVVIRPYGYKEVRERVTITGNPMAAPFVSFFLERIVPNETDRVAPTRFPGEDPYVVDVRDLDRTYPQRALQEYERAIEDDRNGDTARATGRLEEVVRLAPDFAYARNTLGTLYQKAERFRDAEREYNAAYALNDQFVQPLVNLGSLYIQEADANSSRGMGFVGRILDAALDVLEKAGQLRPGSGIVHFLLGTAYYKSSFYEEAEDNLERSLAMEEQFGSARLMLANVYIQQERWEGVVGQLNAYLAENPATADRAQIEAIRDNALEQLADSGR